MIVFTVYMLPLFIYRKNISYGHKYCFLQLGKCSQTLPLQQAWSPDRLTNLWSTQGGSAQTQNAFQNERMLLPLCLSKAKYGFPCTIDSICHWGLKTIFDKYLQWFQIYPHSICMIFLIALCYWLSQAYRFRTCSLGTTCCLSMAQGFWKVSVSLVQALQA